MQAILDFFESFGANIALLLVPLGLGAMYVAFQIIDPPIGQTIRYIFATAPLWLPVLTFYLFFEFWLYYVRKKFDLSQGRVTLEIKIPQEVFKSPEAMELVLIQLHQTAAPDNHVQTYWDGKHQPVYSLEIASRGGDVHLYANVPRKKFKNLIEAQLYAQYPGIEVHELDVDYATEVPWDPDNYSYFSLHFGPKKADALPIKTYIDFGLDKLPKEEEKIDPISSMIEAMSTIGPGEYMWVQIIISANREENFKTGSLTKQPDWKEAARKEITKILETAKKRLGSEQLSMMNITDTERDTIKAIERSLGKNAFDTAIRGMYIGKNDVYNPGERIGALITGWRSYDDLNRNAIGPRWRTDFDWNWWQDPRDSRKKALKKQELDEYKRRAYTSHNKLDHKKVLTTEELATIFHVPGKVVISPALSRIQSKRGEPPANLPVGSL